MPGGRSNPTLFEVLQRSGRARTPANRPQPNHDGRGPQPSGGGQLRVPVYAVYIAATVVLALMVAIWAIAFQVGAERGRERAIRTLGLAEGPILSGRDPLLIDDPRTDRTHNAQSATPRQTPQPLSTDPTPPFLAPRGGLDADPRQAGHNYLKLASRIEADEAVRLVSYLAQNGVEALAVRVEPTARQSNNPPRYDLYSLLAIPSSRFAQSRTERTQHQSRIAELGRLWLAEHRGTQNLSGTGWVLYQGGRSDGG